MSQAYDSLNEKLWELMAQLEHLNDPDPNRVAQKALWELNLARFFWKQIEEEMEVVLNIVCANPGPCREAWKKMKNAFGDQYDELMFQVARCADDWNILEVIYAIYRYLVQLKAIWETRVVLNGSDIDANFGGVALAYWAYRLRPGEDLAGFIRHWIASKW